MGIKETIAVMTLVASTACMPEIEKFPEATGVTQAMSKEMIDIMAQTRSCKELRDIAVVQALRYISDPEAAIEAGDPKVVLLDGVSTAELIDETKGAVRTLGARFTSPDSFNGEVTTECEQ
jgi:hypothetical protein